MRRVQRGSYWRRGREIRFPVAACTSAFNLYVSLCSSCQKQGKEGSGYSGLIGLEANKPLASASQVPPLP